MRPPQPTVAPSGRSACQVDCWSLCENSLVGRGAELLRYCALVIGCISGPALDDDRQPAGVEQRLHAGHRRVQCKAAAVRCLGAAW